MSAGESTPAIPWMKIKLLTVPQVANWAQVSTKTVYRWIKDGEIEAFRLGSRTYRIPAKAVEGLLEKQSGYARFIEAEE
jgi:excisionase family DNA binding protein